MNVFHVNLRNELSFHTSHIVSFVCYFPDITKTRLFKYIENFTTKKMKIFR